MLNYLIFAISLIALVFSASYLVSFSRKLSTSLHLSPLVIGTTLVAFGTSMPEFSIAVSAITQKASALSFGDIIGSNIANVCLILGISVLFFPIRIGTEKTQRNNLILLLLTACFISLYFLPLGIRKIFAFGLLSFYFIFVLIEFRWGKIGSKKEDKKALAKLEKKEKTKKLPVNYMAGMFFSLAGIGAASKYLVSSATEISTILNLEKEIIGLTIIAIGTSLPELSTSILSGVNREYKLLVGDIQGSNIYNLSLVGTILLLFGNVSGEIHEISLIYLAITTISISTITHIFKGKIIPRILGLFLIGIYISYLYFIL